ncbi:MAG: 5-formyltetrahydrofolate cyclo-ligase [Candidatus Saccharibacteria bacterium]|nr:5-formyltetrahydrofolate cyclo-ligase [Candidatus Saccharibacteria bacterium]
MESRLSSPVLCSPAKLFPHLPIEQHPHALVSNLNYNLGMNQEKAKLRQRLKRQRQQMVADEVAAKSRAIAWNLLSLVDWPTVRVLHIYSAVAEWNEVDTRVIIKEVRSRWPKIDITIAHTSKNQPIPTAKYDLIVIPVLGFDKDNHRLGLGGGFYDRFLASQPQAKKIGLCFSSCFVAGGLPHEAHDIPLDNVITEV